MPVSAHRSFLEFHQLPAAELLAIIRRAAVLADAWKECTMPQSLLGKRVVLIADDSGWRNTTAFDLGIQAMGGLCIHAPIGFNIRETTADLGAYLDNWFDILVVRTKELEVLRELSAMVQAPVINARTKSNHPCETLGDLSYVMSRRGHLEGLKVVCVAPDANIVRSWVEASIALPMHVTQLYPARWHVTDAALLNGNFKASTDMAVLSDADIIITDSWPGGADQSEFEDFRVTASWLDTCRPEVIFLPCPPVARGQEVSSDAMLHPSCQSHQAKAFLLHAQNALLEWIVS
jgi:ornithine carbamoyltransferase